MMNRLTITVVVSLGTCFFALTSLAAEYSQLWGKQGEVWKAESRLPDFSFAGYRRGEHPLPTIDVAADVTEFGADGSDDSDDTKAFRQAIAKTPRGAISIPEGRYIISDIVEIRKPGIVLRGAGADKTTLYFPRELEDVRPNMGATSEGQTTSNYSWSGGFLRVVENKRSRSLTKLVASAHRGDTTIEVELPATCKPGDSICIQLYDDQEKSLLQYLYAGDGGPIDKLNNRKTSFVARVTQVDGRQVEIDRPLPFEIRLAWRPEVLQYSPDVIEVGIESMRFEFPNRPYQGHFTERGANAIALDNVSDCWVKDIAIHNCDSGIFVTGHFCTVDTVTITSERERDGDRESTGHHGIQVSGNDNLVKNFNIQTRFIHDLTVARCHGNVFCDGRAEDLCLDHHKDAPYANLFTNLNAGAGTRLWLCGGGFALGRQTAGWATFWNISADRSLKPPPRSFGPTLMNFVGLKSDEPTNRSPDSMWFEAFAPEDLQPQNLWRAQLERRISK